MRKKALFTTLAAAVLACVLVLTGCGASPEAAIREDLTARFESITADDDFVDGFISSAGDYLDQLGVDPEEYAQAYLDGFDFEVGDIAVDGDTATAEVTLTCKSLGSIISNFTTKYQDELTSMEAIPSSEEELYAIAGQIMVEVTDELEPTSQDLTLTYTKDDEGSWVSDDENEGTITSAMMS